MLTIRTDMAVEAHALWRESAGETTRLGGVAAREEQAEGLAVTRVEILDQEGARALGKPVGVYLTLDVSPLWRREEEAFARAVRAVAALLTVTTAAVAIALPLVGTVGTLHLLLAFRLFLTLRLGSIGSGCLGTILATRLAARLLLFVETGYILTEDVVVLPLLGILRILVAEKGERFLTTAVHLYHLKRPFRIDGHQICCHLFVGRICYLLLEDIGLEMIVCGIGSLQAYILLGKEPRAFHIRVHLKIKATFELCTLPGKLLRI